MIFILYENCLPTGGMLGTTYTFILTVKLLDVYHNYFIAFYVTGAISIAWGVICIIMVCDSPGKHNSITEKEKNYISTTVEPIRETKVCNIFLLL